MGIKDTQSSYYNINTDRGLFWRAGDFVRRKIDENSFDYKRGSSQYPRISEETETKSWQLYQPNCDPINANSIMTDYETLPTLEDIQSLIRR